MKISVIVFPGTNCDHDIVHTYQNLLGHNVESVWHKEKDLKSPDVVIVPGGFAHGDYLRTGAMARVSPIMKEIKKFALGGGPVLGVCNGFQILCESELLPGALLRNLHMQFISQFVNLKIESTNTVFTSQFKKGETVCWPMAHMEGNYFCDPETLRRLEDNGQIVFRYCSKSGLVDENDRESNPNGSLHAIAGISNEKGNVVGLMPHPERAAESLVGFVGSGSGVRMFEKVA